MRFTKVLHPEVVLNKRGHPVVRNLYQHWVQFVTQLDIRDVSKRICYEFDYSKVKTELDLHTIKTLEQDNMFAQHVCLVKKFIHDKGSVFHFTKALTEDLSEMDKEIPSEMLPANFLGYISFPPETIRDENSWIEGGYIAICNAGESIQFGKDEPKIPGEEKTDRVIWISYICSPDSHNNEPVVGMSGIGGLLMPFVSTRAQNLLGRSMDYSIQAWGKTSKPSQETEEKRTVVYRTLLNCLIYLTCKNANLELSRPASQRGLSNKEIQRRGEVINECTIPVTFVNRTYHGIKYSKDSTQVRSYLGFRHTKEGLALVPVKGHERHFKNEKETST